MNEEDRVRALVAQLGVGVVAHVPEREAREDDDGWVERAWARLGSEPPAPRAPARGRRRRRWAAAVPVAAALTLVAVIVARPDPALATAPVLAFSDIAGDLSPTSGVPAGDALADLADAASRRGAAAGAGDAAGTQHVVSDQWRLEVTTDAAGAVSTVIRPTRDESWLLPSGRLRLREVVTDAAFSPDGHLTRSDPTGAVVRDEIVTETRGARYAEDLPTDAPELARLWLADRDPDVIDPPSEASVLVAHAIDLHNRWVVPPALDAAIWSSLAGTGEARDLGTVTDRIGRSGRAIAVWDASTDTLEVLIADPTTGALLDAEAIVFGYPGVEANQQVDAPFVGAFTCYLTSEWSH